MKASIFLNEISVIDHAYMDKDQIIHGGSFLVSFIVTGKVDKTEKVVVDFSTIKKDIKTIIDHHSHDLNENGLDHKLWLLKDSYNSLNYREMKIIQLKFNSGEVSLPTDAIKFMEEVDEYTIPKLEKYIADFVLEKLSPHYCGAKLSIECKLSEKPVLYSAEEVPYRMFRYVHGLKDSTSYGCQNIAHGHLSYIQTNDLDKITDLNDIIFINSKNVLENNETFIEIGYTTSRGNFKAKYNKSNYHIIILDTETTIEYLVKYIKDIYKIKTDLYVSEGLTKGAVIW